MTDTANYDTVSAQDQRDKALDDMLAFVREQVAGTTRRVTLNIHHLPLALFDENGPFDSVLVRHHEGSSDHYLAGQKRFGAVGSRTFDVTGFSESITARPEVKA
jgi:hypothetical protein